MVSDGFNMPGYREQVAVRREEKLGMPLKTNDLLQGDRVQLISFGETDSVYRRRLFSFGLTRGVLVRVIRRAPLGCPIQLNVRGTDFMLRAAEASHLLWERV